MNKEDLIKLREKILRVKKVGDVEKVLDYKTMYQRFYDIANDIPDSVAINYFGCKFTYRQLLSLIDDAAKGFMELGIKENDVVAMSMLAEPNSIITLYALDKIGATMHMVNTLSSEDEISRELNKVPSKYFVCTDIFCTDNLKNVLINSGVDKIVASSLTDSIPNVINFNALKYHAISLLKGLKKKKYDNEVLFSFNKILEIGRNSDLKCDAVEYRPNKIATIAYTSGSDGNAKACMASWDRIDSMIQVMGVTEMGRFAQNDVMFSTFPLWIYYSLLNMIHEPLILGVTLALDPVFSPKDIYKRNDLYKFNHWLTIPPYINEMVKLNKKMDCSKWKIVLTGGSELSNEIKYGADDFIRKNGGNIQVVQGYGASEMLGSFAYSYNNNPTVGSLGIPCVGNFIKVLDIDTKQEVKRGETGVAYLYSPARMNGYYGDENATNHNLITDENGVVWYNSEDLVHQNENGEIFLDDRIRRIALTIDKGGNPTKIIPSRIRRCILAMDIVSDCEVITVNDPVYENKAVAYVVLKDNNLEIRDIRNKIYDYCSLNIPDYMIPADILFVDSIPRLSNQKHDIKTLEKQYAELEVKTSSKKLKKN